MYSSDGKTKAFYQGSKVSLLNPAWQACDLVLKTNKEQVKY